MRDHCQAVRDALQAGTACLGTVDSWLVYRLTGGQKHVTDVTNASRTLLLDLRTRDWHAPTLELVGIPLASLPEVRSNSEEYGRVECGLGQAEVAGSRRHFFGDDVFATFSGSGGDEALASRTRNAYSNVPVAGSLGDQMAALLGQRCGPGAAKNTYGTGCFMLLNTGPGKPAPSSHGLLTTVAFQLGPQAAPHYALEGSVAVAGRGISWLKDNLGLISSAEESERLAATVSDTAGVYFVPAFSGLLAPRWDDSARGALLGLTGHTTRAHVVRAMLEAVCFQTREVLEAMRADVAVGRGLVGGGSGAGGSSNGALAEAAGAATAASAALTVLRVDGGAAQNALLMQLQADLLQVDVERPTFLETTAVGAALAAGLAVGFYDRAFVEPWEGGGAASAAQASAGARVFRPAVPADEAARRYDRWNKAVSRSVGLADLAD